MCLASQWGRLLVLVWVLWLLLLAPRRTVVGTWLCAGEWYGTALNCCHRRSVDVFCSGDASVVVASGVRRGDVGMVQRACIEG